MDPVTAVSLLGGVAETRDLRAMGVSPHALADAAANGALAKVRRGCYARLDANPVQVAATALRGIPTCVTAAAAQNLPLLEKDVRIHLAFPRGTSFGGRGITLPSNVVPHYVRRDHKPLKPVSEAIDSCVRCLAREQQLILVDAALERGRLLPRDIASFQLTGTQRRAWLIRNADAGAQSLTETLARLAFVRAGFRVRTQVSVAGVGRVDVVINDRVIVEVDGRDYHSSPEAFARDRRRDRAAFLAGYIPLRCTYAEVVYGMEAIVAQVRAALGVK